MSAEERGQADFVKKMMQKRVCGAIMLRQMGRSGNNAKVQSVNLA